MARLQPLWHRIVPIVLLSVALIGCDAPADPKLTVEITVEPTLEATFEAPASTLTRTPSPTMPIAPRTPKATRTPLPPFGTLTSTPDFHTPDHWTVAEREDFPSPSGEWMVHSIYADNSSDQMQSYYRVVAERTDGSQMWLLEENWLGSGFGLNGVAPVLWSQDEQYLYFKHTGFGDGCGPYFSNGYDMLRLDLSDGTVETVVYGLMAYAFSPDESLLAYISSDQRNRGYIAIRELASGNDQYAAFELYRDFPNAGSIVWVPDQSAVVFVSISGRCGDPVQPFSIIRVDYPAMQSIILIDKSPVGYVPVEWDQPDRILLRVFGVGESFGWTDNHWWLDPITGKLTPR
jgi:hypothetical protein